MPHAENGELDAVYVPMCTDLLERATPAHRKLALAMQNFQGRPVVRAPVPSAYCPREVVHDYSVHSGTKDECACLLIPVDTLATARELHAATRHTTDRHVLRIERKHIHQTCCPRPLQPHTQRLFPDVSQRSSCTTPGHIQVQDLVTVQNY